MPPRTRRPVPIDLDDLHAKLAGGRQARVQVAPSAQFPDGARGLVRRIGAPDVDGDEFIFVEVTVGGAKDTLPFAPSDLSLPGAKATPPARAASATRPARTTPAIPTGPVGPPATVGRAGKESPRSPSSPTAISAVPNSAVSNSAAPNSAVPNSAVPGSTAATSGPGTAPAKSLDATGAAQGRPKKPSPGVPAPAPRSVPGRAGKSAPAKRPRRSPVTITLSTTGEPHAAWNIEATIGTRKAIKPTPLTPARVWELVRSLENPQLSDLVGSQLLEYRRAAEQRANELSSQLADLVAELNSLPDNTSLSH